MNLETTTRNPPRLVLDERPTVIVWFQRISVAVAEINGLTISSRNTNLIANGVTIVVIVGPALPRNRPDDPGRTHDRRLS